MKLLITGAAGFIGTNFLQYLKNKKWPIDQIMCIDNLSTGRDMAIHHETLFYKNDIRDRAMMDQKFAAFKPTHCLHLAGLVSIYDCNTNPQEAFDNNVIGSINIIENCIKHNTRLIAAETSAVYEGVPLTDDGYNEYQSCPETIYAITKAAVANLIHSAARHKGLKYNLLRFFNVAGYLQDYRRTVPSLHCGFIIRIIQDKPVVVFGDETKRRDFIHVDDVCDFLFEKCMLTNGWCNETYNLGTGESWSLAEIKDLIYKTFDKNPIQPIYLPAINAEAHTIFADIDKALATGWTPKKGMKEIVEDTYHYLQNEIKLGNIAADYMDDIEQKYLSVKI